MLEVAVGSEESVVDAGEAVLEDAETLAARALASVVVVAGNTAVETPDDSEADALERMLVA